MRLVVSQLTEYGDVVSAAPMFVQIPAPAGERWNCAEAMPEPVSAESDETVTVAPLTLALAAGAVIDPLGTVESLVKVSSVAFDVLPAASVDVTDSVGLFAAPAGQAKLFVVVYGPPAGALTVWAGCVQPPTAPPRAGKIEDVGPEPVSVTVFRNWKLPAAAPR